MAEAVLTFVAFLPQPGKLLWPREVRMPGKCLCGSGWAPIMGSFGWVPAQPLFKESHVKAHICLLSLHLTFIEKTLLLR
jgi:hypothetical protein